MNKGQVVIISTNDKRYNILDRESYGDYLKINFMFEEVIYFGIVTSISSSGNYVVSVKGIYGTDPDI